MLAASGRSGLEAEYLRRFEDDLHGLRVLTFSMLRLSAMTISFHLNRFLWLSRSSDAGLPRKASGAR